MNRNELILRLRVPSDYFKQSVLKIDAHLNNKLSLPEMSILGGIVPPPPYVEHNIINLDDLTIAKSVTDIEVYLINKDSKLEKITLGDGRHSQSLSRDNLKILLNKALSPDVDAPIVIITHTTESSLSSTTNPREVYLINYKPKSKGMTYLGPSKSGPL